MSQLLIFDASTWLSTGFGFWIAGKDEKKSDSLYRKEGRDRFRRVAVSEYSTNAQEQK